LQQKFIFIFFRVRLTALDPLKLASARKSATGPAQ
jgi:hypothetical protein